MRLANQVCIVTGAGRGIGRAIARGLAGEGAKVALLSRTRAETDAVAAQILAEGGIARAYPADVNDLGSVSAAFEAVARDLGEPDLVVNNAAAFSAIGPIWEVDPEAWRRDVETSLLGAFHGGRVALPGMIARGRGRVINLVGGGTATSFPQGSGYGTGKAGLLRFTECVSDTLAGTGVCMFALDPGLVRTSMTEYQLTSEAGRKHLSRISELFAAGIDVPPTLAAKLCVEIATGRFDKVAGRMLMAARGDLDLDAAALEEIVAKDLRSLRVNGMPGERPYVAKD